MRRTGSSPDRVSLAAGIALIAFGAILLLDRMGSLHLTFAVAAPLAFAVVGIVLIASGLGRRE